MSTKSVICLAANQNQSHTNNQFLYVYFKFYNNQQNVFGFQDRISLDKKKLVEEGKDLKSLKSKSDLSQLKTSKVIYQRVVTTVWVQNNLQYKFIKRSWKTVSITIAALQKITLYVDKFILKPEILCLLFKQSCQIQNFETTNKLSEMINFWFVTKF